MSEDVRLGGIIAKVDNFKDKTRLEIVNLPISKSGKPDIDEEPTGRFIAYFDGYLEPVAFSEGRLLTVVGKGAGEEEGKIGEHEYVFPIIKGKATVCGKLKNVYACMTRQPTFTHVTRLTVACGVMISHKTVK